MAAYSDPTTGKPLRQPYRENSEYAAMVVRMLKSMGRRAAGDPDLLSDLKAIEATVDQLMGDAIASLLREGYSWSDVGERLGMPRQNAHRKYARGASSD